MSSLSDEVLMTLGIPRARLLFFVASATLASAVVGVAAQPILRAHQERQRADERIRALEREADALAAQERTLLVELRQLEVERELREAELARLRATAEQTTRELARIGQEVDRLAAEVGRQRPEVAARLVELYKLGRAGYWRLLLNVENLRDLGRAYRTVAALARLDRERLVTHQRVLAELVASRAALEARQAELRRVEAEAVRTRAALDRAAALYRQRIREIDARRDLAAQLAGDLQVARDRLDSTVDALAAGRGADPTLPLAPFRGDLDWPVDGRLAAPTGPPGRAQSGSALRRPGIDIVAPEGAPVRAVHPGTVVYAAPFTGYGHVVILDHGDRAYTLYGYLADLSVASGTRVSRGQVLGTVGRPPAGASPRLYFEIRVDGQPVDPVEWLRKRGTPWP